VCPEEGNQDGERSRQQNFRETAEVTWLVHLMKRRLKGDLVTVNTFLKGVVEGEVLISSFW